jgi:hypothetical protein
MKRCYRVTELSIEREGCEWMREEEEEGGEEEKKEAMAAGMVGPGGGAINCSVFCCLECE